MMMLTFKISFLKLKPPVSSLHTLCPASFQQLAVCFIELWPEARACKNDRGLAVGMLIGIVVMGWTLWVEA